MKRLYLLFFIATAGTLSALAQWNTNATPKLLFGLEYTDPETGQVRTGGDYYACDPVAVRTPDKKTWIAWKTWGKKEVNGIKRDAVRTYLQLLDRDGKPQFDEPIMVNDYITTSWWSKYGLQVAADGSAIVTVADGRAEEADLPDDYIHADGFQPAIYKIDQEGNFLWGLDGVQYPEYHNAPYTNCYVVGEDTYFLFLSLTEDSSPSEEGDMTTGMFIQRINDDGTTAWEKPRKWADWTGSMPTVQIVPSTDGDLLLFDASPDGARVHRLNRELEEVWGEPVTYDPYKYDGYALDQYSIAIDGEGGAAVAFVRPMGNFTHNIRVQYIGADGSLGFGLEGLDCANTEDNDYDYSNLSLNPKTKEILVDFESQMPETYDVMLQKFSFDGEYLFPELGLSIAAKDRATNPYAYGRIGNGPVGDSDWIVAYRDVSSYVNSSFVIRRYDKDGKRLWTKTIGRDLMPTDINFFVEEEAVYLIYREESGAKEPGIKIFRIGSDGTYNVTYNDEQDAIQDVKQTNATAPQYFTADGKRVAQPQRGLNIVRQQDGTVRKQLQ